MSLSHYYLKIIDFIICKIAKKINFTKQLRDTIFTVLNHIFKILLITATPFAVCKTSSLITLSFTLAILTSLLVASKKANKPLLFTSSLSIESELLW